VAVVSDAADEDDNEALVRSEDEVMYWCGEVRLEIYRHLSSISIFFSIHK
jgi:hypothetical protein